MPAATDPFALLTIAEMGRADSLAMAAGVPGHRLMEAAGWAVAREARRLRGPCRVAVLCGPGNNGGDGFVAARLLAEAGYVVRLALLGRVEALKGDAAIMAGRWRGPVEPLGPAVLARADLVIDALFGAGLSRPLTGAALDIIPVMARPGVPVVAVDVPSGIDGDSGAVLGAAAQATTTVTFFRKKPGHLLLPGRAACGRVVVADIGIPGAVLEAIAPSVHENAPGLWDKVRPRPLRDGHKYARGHALVVGGPMAGAGRLAARAARRVGAGLVSAAVPPDVESVFRAGDPGLIVRPLSMYEALLEDKRYNAVLVGPGMGVDEAARRRTEQALAAGKAVVVDADALTAFAGEEERLFARLSDRALLTPHEGEFRRLFGEIPGSRLDRARAAAKRSGAVVLLKGTDTVIAHPDGRAVINSDAPADLATAGTGDVLAGLALGLLAQGMKTLMAAAAAVWLHSAAARACGPGLIAEDLAEALPPLLAGLRAGAR